MAKGIGLIGNFKGKVGNMVGYKLSDSNTGNTQGIRVYQPIVRNPKTSAQAEQRAKLAPINATYRALKMVIDRGNEGLPYGNKSRLAWLKQAFKSEQMPWYVKGAIPTSPVGCLLTKGSLPSVSYSNEAEVLRINVPGLTADTDVSTVGKLSAALIAGISTLKEGDQLTIVVMLSTGRGVDTIVTSIVLDSTSADAQTFLEAAAGRVQHEFDTVPMGFAVIVSRQGSNGEHLRSSESLVVPSSWLAQEPYDADSKAAAIESYQNAASANSDWAEESIQ